MFDCGTAGPLRVLWLHAIKAFDKPGAQGSGIRGGGGGGGWYEADSVGPSLDSGVSLELKRSPILILIFDL